MGLLGGYAAAENCADISANVLKVGDKKFLKIFNKGSAIGKNVKIFFPDGNEIICEQEINEKFSINLEKYQSLELDITCYMTMPKKIRCLFTWEDSNSLANEKELHLAL